METIIKIFFKLLEIISLTLVWIAENPKDFIGIVVLLGVAAVGIIFIKNR